MKVMIRCAECGKVISYKENNLYRISIKQGNKDKTYDDMNRYCSVDCVKNKLRRNNEQLRKD